jgi:uncharacterized membrane protein
MNVKTFFILGIILFIISTQQLKMTWRNNFIYKVKYLSMMRAKILISAFFTFAFFLSLFLIISIQVGLKNGLQVIYISLTPATYLIDRTEPTFSTYTTEATFSTNIIKATYLDNNATNSCYFDLDKIR